MTKTTLTALALATTALAAAAFAVGDGASAKPLPGSSLNRVIANASALHAAATFKSPGPYHPTTAAHKPPPPSCYPRADCVGNGNHGTGGPSTGGDGTNENANGAGPSGYDIDHGPTVCLASRYCYQPQ
jgi:hypothetical protein